MQVKIDKNVPIPAFISRGENGELVRRMQPGESVFVTDRKAMFNIRAAINTHGFKPVSRREGKGWRIWKTTRVSQ